MLSAAERYQMMPQVGRRVASTMLAKIAENGAALTSQGAVFAINLSGQSLADDDILGFIEEQIEKTGIAPALLCFEIKESAAVTNLKKAQVFIDALRALGCSISLDDFGAGLISFAYLKSFNVDTLKIDGGFVHDITENRISRSMVAAITEVAKVMELKTVAEFVSSSAAVKMLRKIGVDYAQGYYIGEPIAIEPVMEALQKTQAPRLPEFQKTPASRPAAIVNPSSSHSASRSSSNSPTTNKGSWTSRTPSPDRIRRTLEMAPLPSFPALTNSAHGRPSSLPSQG